MASSLVWTIHLPINFTRGVYWKLMSSLASVGYYIILFNENSDQFDKAIPSPLDWVRGNSTGLGIQSCHQDVSNDVAM